MSNAKIELFKEDGTLIFSSEKYKPMSIVGKLNLPPPTRLEKQSFSNSTVSYWDFDINFNIPKLPQNQIVMITPLGFVLHSLDTPFTGGSAYGMRKMYPPYISEAAVRADLASDCLIMEY